MAQQIINVGTNPNDGTGDTLRGAFVKTDDNFDDLYTNKQNTLISGTNIKTINGNSVLGSGNLTISGGVIGSGTTNYVSKFTAASAIGNSQIFDDGTNIGIGTTSPFAKLCLDGTFFAGDITATLPYISIAESSAVITVPGITAQTSGLSLIEGSGEIGINPGGDALGLKFNWSVGVWFVNDQNNKFGLIKGDNSLFAENNIIQTGSVPSNELIPTSWIKIYNYDTNTQCFIPVYE